MENQGCGNIAQSKFEGLRAMEAVGKSAKHRESADNLSRGYAIVLEIARSKA